MTAQPKQEIVVQPHAQNVVPLNDSAALMGAIAEAASNPAIDAGKMERLLAIYEKVEDRRAQIAYAEAFAEMQLELPAIAERGEVSGRYTYALWEDINTAVKPVLAKHGFSLSFRTDFTDGIMVTGVLMHRGGHTEQTSIKLPADPSGNKNAVQAVASAVSYGKRYTASALLNLTSHGEDDDAYRAALSPEAQQAADKESDWLRVADSLEDPQAYTEQKAKLLADYGNNAANLPPKVRGAFNRAKSRVMPKD